MSKESEQNSNKPIKACPSKPEGCRRIKFYTLGCKVNQYESQALIEQFTDAGCTITDGIADLYVINSCSVTARADSKSKELVSKIRKENSSAKIAICGCLVQINQSSLEGLGFDYLISQDDKYSLVDIVLNRQSDQKSIWSLKVNSFSNQRAFVKVQDGCDHFCSFCKIPHIRGRSRSRKLDDVLREVKRLSSLHREIVLCGVNLGLYGRDFGSSLVDLLDSTLELNVGRLRLSSLEPILINDRLLSFLNNPKLCPHLHLPFQSCDNKILKAMNKKETTELYLDVINKARKISPDIAISCDIMVGFPAEDEATFSNTVDFLKQVKPMRMHIFTFSPREKTPFSDLKMTDYAKNKERYGVLNELSKEFSLEYRKRFIAKTLNMVVEEQKDGYVCGYTQNYLRVQKNGTYPLGEIIPVCIEKVSEGVTYAT
ncbi:MAG: tRNA (N(6)-L-threonylcarbamoyladenosine(37)-C(2))-methylthiotransferase MtaB [Candidatus Omnitrophica bacterium]|nr:tRNA (N(6)-L-threonylcarbamoyladenosine(37)-C(2))-methylthiotransferase MtaB [Candidatus Omnitrophota bacterium]